MFFYYQMHVTWGILREEKEGRDFVVRVLQVVTYMGRDGLETMLMNYYAT